MSSNLKQCPCCDYFTLEIRGDYDICPVCFWEDSGQDIDQLNKHSGPNHQTLKNGRENFLKIGACDKKAIKHVLPKNKRNKYKLEVRLV